MMIWVDLDGVLADFDGQYERCFGVRPTRYPAPDSVNWHLVRTVPQFFATLPVMKDASTLLAGIHPRPYKILTGVPSAVDAASNQKVDWVRTRRFTPPPKAVVCCRSRDKCLHGKPGDVLIDDYLKYRHLWVDMGGIFIHHTSAESSVRQLNELTTEGHYHARFKPKRL